MYVQRPKKKVVEQLKAYILKLQTSQPQPSAQISQPQNVQRPVAGPIQQSAQTVDYTKVTRVQREGDMSLKDMMKRIDEEREKKQTVGDVDAKPLDETRVRELWVRYARSIESSNMHLASLMSNPPTVEGENIVVPASNQMQVDLLSSNADLVHFMRYQTGHLNLNIVARIDENGEQVVKEIVYTSKQKLERMLEQNPNVKSLMDVFNLNLEY